MTNSSGLYGGLSYGFANVSGTGHVLGAAVSGTGVGGRYRYAINGSGGVGGGRGPMFTGGARGLRRDGVSGMVGVLGLLVGVLV